MVGLQNQCIWSVLVYKTNKKEGLFQTFFNNLAGLVELEFF